MRHFHPLGDHHRIGKTDNVAKMYWVAVATLTVAACLLTSRLAWGWDTPDAPNIPIQSMALGVESEGVILNDAGWSINDGVSGTEIFAVDTQPDGKVVRAGRVYNGINDDFVLIRYEVDGTRDESFGNQGMVTTDFGNARDQAQTIVLHEDGRISLGGQSCEQHNYCTLTMARYLPNGDLDPSFGAQGKLVTNIGGVNFPHHPTFDVQDDGSIVVSASFCEGRDNCRFDAIQYRSDGVPDQSFVAGDQQQMLEEAARRAAQQRQRRVSNRPRDSFGATRSGQ